MEKRIIVALDFKEQGQVKELVSKLEGELVYVKVGMELFYQQGIEIINWLKEKKLKIFLDLKLHDIPNTVYGGISGLLPLGIDMINIHTSGGRDMMKAAVKAVKDFNGQAPLLIGVTQLTSISQKGMNLEQRVVGRIDEQVLHLASMAKESGLDGVVCSPLEVAKLRKNLGDDFILVTPGVRSSSADRDDQARIATPEEAFASGASYIVVGREITKASDSLSAFKKIVNEVTK